MTDMKALTSVEIKDAAKGTVEAVFATFNVKDHDGDVTLPGAFEDGAPVRISAYGHASWGPSRGASMVPVPPVGKGVIRATDTEAILDGRFFLNTTAGRDHFELIKEMGDQQEWSYGYDTLESAPGTFKGERVNFLKRQIVHEVSPVLLGAGIGTRTIAAKAKQLDSDLRDALTEAGRQRYATGPDSWVYVDDFDVDASWAVFSISTQGGDCEYRKISYQRSDDGSVALTGDDIEVERSTTYVTKSLTFVDEAKAAHDAVAALVKRTNSLAEFKRGELTVAKRDELKAALDALDMVEGQRQAIAELLVDPEVHRELFRREAMRFERLRANV